MDKQVGFSETSYISSGLNLGIPTPPFNDLGFPYIQFGHVYVIPVIQNLSVITSLLTISVISNIAEI
jgi:hypothetical protein